MGREALATLEQVVAAADAMKTAGIKPTSRGVRERIGNVGSLGTINRMLQQWKDAHTYKIAATAVLPAALQRAILEFMDQELAAARTLLEGQLAEQQLETADLATENERQIESIATHIKQNASLAADKAAAEGRCTQLETDLKAAKDETSRERRAADTVRIELAKAQLLLEAIPRLDAELLALRTAIDAERQQRVNAEQSAAVLAAQKTDLANRIADNKSANERLGEQLSKSQEKVERLTAELTDSRIEAHADQIRIALLEHEIPLARTEADPTPPEEQPPGKRKIDRRMKPPIAPATNG